VATGFYPCTYRVVFTADLFCASDEAGDSLYGIPVREKLSP
jgi:hypothetical protein